MAKKVLTHIDESGKATMVNVGGKTVTQRRATAEGYVLLHPETLRAIAEDRIVKGQVLAVARVAAIMAAKRTGDLIPLCHPLGVERIEVDFDLPKPGGPAPLRLRIKATAAISAKTGVEMEALTAVSVAALTIYDMCKAVDKSMVITDIRLIAKSGGKHDFTMV